MNPPRLRLRQFTANRPFYSILLSIRNETALPHVHDFTEIMLVTGGKGWHEVNGARLQMVPGDVILVRPNDCHCIVSGSPAGLQCINIAFATLAWQKWREALGVTSKEWDEALLSPTVNLPEHRRADGLAVFESMLTAYTSELGAAVDSLALGGFWQGVLGFLLAAAPARPRLQPAWLDELCHRMEQEENLQGGIKKMQALSCVHPSHLSRVFRSQLGMAPTQWVREKRLQRAAELLHASSLPVGDIADRCGFNNLSDFYRGFTEYYGVAPRAYRMRAQSAVAPVE